MNAVAPIPMVPGDAPFSAEQRAWLNGFLAGLYGDAAASGGAAAGGVAAPAEAEAEAEAFPWHDPALAMEERMALAEGRPLERRFMAAMAQLDCGQCGYLCQTYAEALASGKETSFSLCVPGAKPTTKMLRAIKAEAGTAAAPAAAGVAPEVVEAPRRAGTTVRVLSAERLSGVGSAKDVRHVVIDLAGSGLRYEPGDSISLLPANDPALVASCLEALGAEDTLAVPCPDGVMRPLGEALTRFADIGRPLDRTLDLLAMAAKNVRHAEALRRLAEGEDAEPADADLLDLLEAFPSARPAVGDLVRSLPALKPRLYSIASSLAATPGQVHLCVSVVNGELRGRQRRGIASGFLGWHAATHGPIEAAIQPSHFRLPEDGTVPIVMVGPGTGIAPFRAFLQERQARGARGRSWLFFGEQTEANDFLFRSELQGWVKDGTLTRLDCAFSRDQKAKNYVQDRMREAAAELWRWLQEGAHFFVCGDATRMARDVDATLRDVARVQGRMSEDDAKNWVVTLARQGRYKRDVY